MSVSRAEGGGLTVRRRMKERSICIDGVADIVLLTQAGDRSNGVYFNMSDLVTDASRDAVKLHLERFMRLYYGMTFL